MNANYYHHGHYISVTLDPPPPDNWPARSLRAKGLTAKNWMYRRPMTDYERQEVAQMHRYYRIKYTTWAGLLDDDDACGVPQAHIEALTRLSAKKVIREQKR